MYYCSTLQIVVRTCQQIMPIVTGRVGTRSRLPPGGQTASNPCAALIFIAHVPDCLVEWPLTPKIDTAT